MLSARSEEPFPTLAADQSCEWHDDCTPMDCDHWGWKGLYVDRVVVEDRSDGQDR